MNFELIGVLIRLRYKLLWAKTRTRNGKIALFFAGYLLLAMVAMLLLLVGVGAGMTAIRSGRAMLVAGVLLPRRAGRCVRAGSFRPTSSSDTLTPAGGPPAFLPV